MAEMAGYTIILVGLVTFMVGWATKKEQDKTVCYWRFIPRGNGEPDHVGVYFVKCIGDVVSWQKAADHVCPYCAKEIYFERETLS